MTDERRSTAPEGGEGTKGGRRRGRAGERERGRTGTEGDRGTGRGKLGYPREGPRQGGGGERSGGGEEGGRDEGTREVKRWPPRGRAELTRVQRHR